MLRRRIKYLISTKRRVGAFNSCVLLRRGRISNVCLYCCLTVELPGLHKDENIAASSCALGRPAAAGWPFSSTWNNKKKRKSVTVLKSRPAPFVFTNRFGQYQFATGLLWQQHCFLHKIGMFLVTTASEMSRSLQIIRYNSRQDGWMDPKAVVNFFSYLWW